MQLLIGLFGALLFDLLADDFFAPMTADGADEIAFRPKFSTPQALFDRGDSRKNLPRGQTFDRLHNLGWAIRRHRLDQKMDMIFVGANLDTDHVIALGDLQTDVFECRVDRLVKDDAAILGRTHEMGQQDGDIVALLLIFAHASDKTISQESEASFGESAPQRLMRPSFLPPPALQAVRDLTRTRVALVRTRSQAKKGLHKILEDTNINLSRVVSDLGGARGRRRRAALLAGERAPRQLAAFARKTVRRKLPALEVALTGQCTEPHGRLLPGARELSELLARQITALDGSIGELVAPVQAQMAQLDTIPGLHETAARAI
jgi:hypothetical protein